ncbi:MAG: hypothetical protein IT363_05740 [Methanoregulaceae archaeon]|nr:hypothetical protein [Methanoregulaceae archaeon]
MPPPIVGSGSLGISASATLFIVAAVLVLKPVGVRIALGASLMTCALILVGMQYTIGLEAALFIYALASVGFGADLLRNRKRPGESSPGR